MDAPVRLGPYRLTALLGVGGYASVYRAVRQGAQGFARRYAVKVLDPSKVPDMEHARKALADEARIGGRAEHPNVVGILDSDTTIDTPFLVLELVEGWSLEDVTDALADHAEGGAPPSPETVQTPMPPRLVVEIGYQLTDALAYVHNLTDPDGKSLGLIHRDLKPANVLVSRRGVVKLTDFGIARAESRMATTTRTGMTRGTPCYMSPEQVRGSSNIDFRSDLFSLGGVLHTLLTGERFFEMPGGIAPTLHAVLSKDMGPAFARAEAILPGIGPILRRLWARSPRKRYESAREARADLRVLLEGLPGRDLKTCMEGLAEELPGTRRNGDFGSDSLIYRLAATAGTSQTTAAWADTQDPVMAVPPPPEEPVADSSLPQLGPVAGSNDSPASEEPAEEPAERARSGTLWMTPVEDIPVPPAPSPLASRSGSEQAIAYQDEEPTGFDPNPSSRSASPMLLLAGSFLIVGLGVFVLLGGGQPDDETNPGVARVVSVPAEQPITEATDEPETLVAGEEAVRSEQREEAAPATPEPTARPTRPSPPAPTPSRPAPVESTPAPPPASSPTPAATRPPRPTAPSVLPPAPPPPTVDPAVSNPATAELSPVPIDPCTQAFDTTGYWDLARLRSSSTEEVRTLLGRFRPSLRRSLVTQLVGCTDASEPLRERLEDIAKEAGAGPSRTPREERASRNTVQLLRKEGRSDSAQRRLEAFSVPLETRLRRCAAEHANGQEVDVIFSIRLAPSGRVSFVGTDRDPRLAGFQRCAYTEINAQQGDIGPTQDEGQFRVRFAGG